MLTLDADTMQVRKQCRMLVERAADVFFTTVDAAGFPQTRCMFNLRCRERFPGIAPLFDGHEDDLMVYFGTNTSSLKVQHLKSNPRVAAYYCEPQSFRGLMLSGTVTIVEDAQIKQAIWQPGWEMYYHLGPTDPDYTVLSMLPARAKGWWEGRPFDIALGVQL